MGYAEGTSVPVVKSRIEIEQLLTKYGATRRVTAEEPGRAVIYFEMADRHVQFTMPLARLEGMPKGDKLRRPIPEDKRRQLLEQRHREQWRTLVLVLKAKFTALEGQVETFDQCFLAHIILPGGGTVGAQALPALAEAYKTGKVSPGFLLGPGSGS